jgi:hypothetical protein
MVSPAAQVKQRRLAMEKHPPIRHDGIEDRLKA